MSTKYIASNWRLPNQENSSKSDNYGLTFSGTSEYINCGGQSLFNGLTAFSISCWIKTDGTQQDYAAVFSYQSSTSQYVKLAFYPSEKDRIRVVVRPGSSNPNYVKSSAGSIVDGEWVHIVAVGDANNLSNLNVYINGVLDNDVTQGNITTLAQSSDIYIGTDAGAATTREFQGNISEVAVFDYALTSTQISTLYGSSSLGAGNPMALKPQPVAFYPLGDNSASNPLTQPNEAVADASVFDFDSSNNTRIDLGTAPSYSTLTLSAWFKKNSLTPNYAGVFGTRNSNSLQMPYILSDSGSEKFRFRICQSNGTSVEIISASALSNDVWYNVVGVADGSNINLYINGVAETPISYDGTIKTPTNELTIGAQNEVAGTNLFDFDGQISNCQLWDTGLSASEVTTLYNSGVPLLTGTQPQASNLKAWYKLDQSANWDVSSSGNWTIPDASGNGNDGTSSGMTSANLVLSDLSKSIPYDSYSFLFDGINDNIEISSGTLFDFGSNPFSFSAWVKRTSIGDSTDVIIHIQKSGSTPTIQVRQNARNIKIDFNVGGTWSFSTTTTNPIGNDTNWHHLVVTKTGTSINTYFDGVLQVTDPAPTTLDASNGVTFIGCRGGNTQNWDGGVSNVSIFNQELTSTEVMKLYSNGMPQDLSSYNPQPISWWTLGSNSFFNGTNYICRDLIGSNDGTSANAGVDAIVGDSPRSSANGVGTNNSIPENLVGTTKYSSNNSWSINMSETARVEDTP